MSEPLAIPRLVVAGLASGVGKTTLTVGLCRALAARGLVVAPFKCGPDYLDPTYHARAAKRPSHNLDGWMMGREAVRSTFARGAAGADVAIIEGVMGLFDGASPTGEAGSSAEIAKWLGAPVLLVIDASGMARTIAAIVQGVASFDPALRLAGVIANRVGSAGHLELLRKASPAPPILGGLAKEPAAAFPERHLGLRTADRDAVPESALDRWGRLVAEGCALDAILAVARSAPPLEPPPPTARRATVRCRLGLAYDEAFHFYYEENLRALEEAGAEIVRFSPIADQQLPPVDGLYLGGGYPELHAAALGANRSLRQEIARFAARGRPIYAECGGLMFLAEAIRTLDGVRHEMVGLIPGEAVVHGRLQALGYVEVETRAETILGPAGLRFRGHQFRYSALTVAPEIERAYAVRRRRGDGTEPEGFRRGALLASYVHAHFASNPRLAEGLVAACAEGAGGSS